MYYIIRLKEIGENKLNSREEFGKELAFEVARKLNFIADGTTDFVRFRPILVSAVDK